MKKHESKIMDKKSIEDMLSPEFRVAVKIYELTEVKKPPEITYYSKLIELLKGSVSKVTISKAIDNLLDISMINAKWDKTNGKWVRSFKITSESKGTIESVYRHIQAGK